jgi:nucleotide-binding universal stress UspA family protein
MSGAPHPIVVVGFDGSPASHAALARAIERVNGTGTLYLVHAWQDRPDIDPDDAVKEATSAHPGLADIRWVDELIAGPPAKAIADVADVRGADEIIVGTRGFGRVRALLGSVAHELIHLARCPVTVIPARMVETEADEVDATVAAA